MYRRTYPSWLKHLDFILLDFLCLHAAFVAAYVYWVGPSVPYVAPVYQTMAVVLSLIQIAVSVYAESFKGVLRRGYYVEFAKTLWHVVLVVLLGISYLFTQKESESVSRMVFGLTAVFYLVLSYVVRIAWKLVLKKTKLTMSKRSLLIATTRDIAQEVVSNTLQGSAAFFHISGIALLDGDGTQTSIGTIPVVATGEELLNYTCRSWVDEVLIAMPEGESCDRTLCDRLDEMGVVVHTTLMENSPHMGRKQIVERFGNYTVLTSSINFASPGQLLLKRAMDIVGGLLGCILTGLLCLVIGPMIYLQSPGPLFFKQERVGRNGKRFKIYKFRSMYMDAEERKKELMQQNRIKDGRMFKLDWDPRIIGSRQLPDGTQKKGIGNFIRDTSIDEFPQFFNVLKGEMSLVGTRPPTVDEWEQYELHHHARLAIKPGITGMWQVSGRSNITDFEEVVQLDTRYIRQWNLGLDLKILAKTVGVVLKKEGSM